MRIQRVLELMKTCRWLGGWHAWTERGISHCISSWLFLSWTLCTSLLTGKCVVLSSLSNFNDLSNQRRIVGTQNFIVKLDRVGTAWACVKVFLWD
jgi:hypothetical protein